MLKQIRIITIRFASNYAENDEINSLQQIVENSINTIYLQ